MRIFMFVSKKKKKAYWKQWKNCLKFNGLNTFLDSAEAGKTSPLDFEGAKSM